MFDSEILNELLPRLSGDCPKVRRQALRADAKSSGDRFDGFRFVKTARPLIHIILHACDDLDLSMPQISGLDFDARLAFELAEKQEALRHDDGFRAASRLGLFE